MLKYGRFFHLTQLVTEILHISHIPLALVMKYISVWTNLQRMGC